MNIEITRGRSDIYDILTHLTFLFVESDKIGRRVLIDDGPRTIRDWQKLEKAIGKEKLSQAEREVALFALKGLNIARIAELRGAREGTVKAQLSSVYAKAGAAGKHELLAGFVEDFLDRAESGSARSGPDGDVRR